MTLGIGSGLDGKEVLEDPHAEAMALLWMELRSHDVAALNDRRELIAIGRERDDVLGVVAHQVVGVGEVEPWILIEVRDQSVRTNHADVVPPHHRDVE